MNNFQEEILIGIPKNLPESKPLDATVSHAPRRVIEGVLTPKEKKLAVRNALRYFEAKHHSVLASEFMNELNIYGRIYMHRFRPEYAMYARPIDEYPHKSTQAAAIMLMIQNNLDPKVAKHPHELITYGGNGAVFQNWGQYLLTMQYLSKMTDEQTLVMYSGHPLGLFPSHKDAPRVVVTNGMMIPNYSSKNDWNKYNALGVTQYGQMTAGSYMYIGPQGIVHGTTITLLNAGRRLRGADSSSGSTPSGLLPPVPPRGGTEQQNASGNTLAVSEENEIKNSSSTQISNRSVSPSGGQGAKEQGANAKETNLAGIIYITSGLGGMSGAQAGAAVITGAVGVISEIDPDAIKQRVTDGYIKAKNVYKNIDQLIDRIEECRTNKTAIALVHDGNIVELWERIVERNIHIELGSDQTSLHNIDDLGYCPVGYTFAEAEKLLLTDKAKFMEEVRSTLRRHVDAINKLTERGMYFWDYGNAFLKEAGEADADIWKNKEEGIFKYPSYVEDIMGPMCFDYGFGPFRWVCTSGDKKDLDLTDKIAGEVLREMLKTAPEDIHPQLKDNITWIDAADENLPIVGSKSRILYADAEGRMKIAKAFNDAIADGRLTAPVVLGRDHHDVSGTDSPFRETANIYDGSRFTADMAIHNVIGDSFRGATWVSIHNGGGVGWGEVINGGFGMLLDGTADSERRLQSMLFWDVNNGIARRSWARNKEAMDTIKRAMEVYPQMQVTVPNLVEDELLDDLV